MWLLDFFLLPPVLYIGHDFFVKPMADMKENTEKRAWMKCSMDGESKCGMELAQETCMFVFTAVE